MPILQRLRIYKSEAILFAGMLGIVFISYFFFFHASRQALLGKETQWREARIELEKVLRRNQMKYQLNQFMNLLEDQRHYADVINIPNEIARKYHLQVPSVTYQKQISEENLMRVSFALSVTGTYEAIRQFISEIEAAKALYIIEDMSLGKSSKEGTSLELQLKMATFLKT